MKRAAAPVLAVLLLVTGCVTVPSSWREQVKSYPLIRLGDQKPADGKYVLHMPAGEPVPTKVLIKGNIFREQGAQEVNAVPRKDIYFFEKWISFDRSTWTPARETLNLGWDVTLPGHGTPEPGTILIKVDRKE